MAKIKLTFLGTGTSQGVPVITCSCRVCRSIDPRDKRLRTSAMIEVKGKVFVIDTGPDFRAQMLAAKTERLDAVLFTHEHKDHVAGLDDIRPFNFRQKEPMDIYASTSVQEALRREYPYIFAEQRYPGAPSVHLHEVNDAVLDVDGIEVTPINIMHGNLPIKGFRVGDVTYITDANAIDEVEKEKIKGSKILVLNALRHKEHHSHFNLEQAIALAEELDAKKTYFTHISHLLGKHVAVSATLPKNMHLAYDGLCVETAF